MEILTSTGCATLRSPNVFTAHGVPMALYGVSFSSARLPSYFHRQNFPPEVTCRNRRVVLLIAWCNMAGAALFCESPFGSPLRPFRAGAPSNRTAESDARAQSLRPQYPIRTFSDISTKGMRLLNSRLLRPMDDVEPFNTRRFVAAKTRCGFVWQRVARWSE